MPTAVIDASVALKWMFREEPEADAALNVLLAFQAGELSLCAPTIWSYEIANAARVAVSRGRLEPEQASEACEALLDLGVELQDFRPLCTEAWQLALDHNLSIYDAAYVVVATQTGAVLYTGDQRLVRALEGAVDCVRWIGDFSG